MNWEEYENSDWYRESHPNWNYKPTREELIEGEMRSYLADLDAYREEQRLAEENEDDEDAEGKVDENGENPKKIVTWITTKIWNGRVRGVLCTGDYEKCRYRKYEYNVACIGSEWDWAGIERIEAENQDELEEIINGYLEIEYEPYYDDYDDEY